MPTDRVASRVRVRGRPDAANCSVAHQTAARRPVDAEQARLRRHCATAGTTCTTRRASPRAVPTTGPTTQRAVRRARPTSPSTSTRSTSTSRLRCRPCRPSRTCARRGDRGGASDLASLVERLYSRGRTRSTSRLKAHRPASTRASTGGPPPRSSGTTRTSCPTFDVVDQPRNLCLGWRTTDYRKLDWALLHLPDHARGGAERGLRRRGRAGRATAATTVPIVEPVPARVAAACHRRAGYDAQQPMAHRGLRLLVPPAPRGCPPRGRASRAKFETWNAIFVGNIRGQEREVTRVRRGKLPYVPLFNTYIPGLPDGRSKFYDIEQLIREKDERISENAQMMHQRHHRAVLAVDRARGARRRAPRLAPTAQPESSLPVRATGSRPSRRGCPRSRWSSTSTRIDRELVDCQWAQRPAAGHGPERGDVLGQGHQRAGHQLRDPHPHAA